MEISFAGPAKEKSHKKYLLLCIFILVLVTMSSPAKSVDTGTLRDPGLPLLGDVALISPGGKNNDLLLQAVYSGEKQRKAVVSGVVIEEGDNVNGVRILKINEKSIIYQKKGKYYTLKLRDGIFD